MNELYERFQIERPPYLADGYWTCIETEADRLWRALEDKDAGQALEYIKCLVESISKVVLDINGTPAGATDSLKKLLPAAHNLLADVRGHELAVTSPFRDMANKAMALTNNLAEIRNNYGGGHGRFRAPDIADEMVHVALDGGLLWTRWALRRIGLFAEGRPTPLIDNLIGTPSMVFRSGDLARRLLAADLPKLDPKHQRSIGIAVGQRAARGTFVVRHDGVDPALADDTLTTWPRDYRIGLVQGLWFDPQDQITLTSATVLDGIRILDPIPDYSAELDDWATKILKAGFNLLDIEDYATARPNWDATIRLTTGRLTSEQPALTTLMNCLEPRPFGP